MPKETQDQDIELDPRKLRFGMSKEELEAIKRKAKERKKMNKGWKPTSH